MKKFFLLMALVAIMSLGYSENIFAINKSQGANDGVQVEVSTIADAYAAGEAFDVTVKVNNTGVYTLEDVGVSIAFPEGLTWLNEEETGVFDLAAGESTVVDLKLRANKKPILDVFNDTVDNGSEAEGNWMPIILAIAFFAIVILAVVVLLVKKKGKGGTGAMMLLCAGLALAALQGDEVYAALQNKVNIPFELQIDNNTVNCNVDVTYSYEPIALETEVTVNQGDKILFENDITLLMKMIDRVEHEYFWGTRMEYTVTVGEEEYSEIYFLDDNGTVDLMAEAYNPYPVKFKVAETGEVKVQIMNQPEMPPALELSGNAEDVYVSENYEYIEGNNYIIYLDKNVKVKGDLVKNLEIVMAEVENQTGYKFDVQNEYTDIIVHGMREQYFEEGAFEGIDPYHEKIAIYVSHQGVYAGISGTRYLVIDPTVLDFNSSDAGTLVYDLCQVIAYRNGTQLSTKMDRGYAFFMAERVMNNLDEFSMNFYRYYRSYNTLREAIPASKAEALYLGEYDIVNSEADYGYRFMHFIHQEYGEEVFHNLLAMVSERNGNIYDIVNSELELDCIKAVTSEDVFEKFGEWHGANRNYFENPYKR